MQRQAEGAQRGEAARRRSAGFTPAGNCRTPAKLALLATLYFSQGLPYGFFLQALPVMMRQLGYDLTKIGLSSALALPWALKFIWAPVVDRHGGGRIGRRRSWILPLQAAAVLLLVTLAAIDPRAGLAPVFVAVFLTNLIAATQDIATDGFAVDLLAPSERGVGNGIQVAGYRVGMIVGGGALLMLYDRIGWALSFLIMAGLLAAATVPIYIAREPPRDPDASQAPPGSPIAGVREALARPGMMAWLVVVFTYKAGDAFASGMLRPFLVDLGLGMSEVGLLLGTVGFVTGLLGALAGGALVKKLGDQRALITFGLLQTFSVATYLLIALGMRSTPMLYAAVGLEHFLGGMATASLFTVMMDACRPEAAATDYTLQASVVVVATGTFAALSGYSADALGYASHFFVSVVMCLLSVAIVAPVMKVATRKGLLEELSPEHANRQYTQP